MIMKLTVERVEVWATTIDDQPGRLAKTLTGLWEAGANLSFILARRAPEAFGKAEVFVTPLQGDAELEAATTLGFNPTTRVHSVRVEGENRPGMAAELTASLAAAGLNLRGFSAAVIQRRFVLYIGFDSTEDAAKAVAVLQQAGRYKKPFQR
jgi:hypothetical protein